MPVSLLLTLYCTLILAASLAGGWLPIFLRLTHRRMEMALSFVAGVILGVGLLHLLPHGYRELGSIDETVRWVLFGFLAMFFVERFFSFHHHGPPDEAGHRDDRCAHHAPRSRSSRSDHAHAPAGSPPLPQRADPAASHHPVLAGGRFSLDRGGDRADAARSDRRGGPGGRRVLADRLRTRWPLGRREHVSGHRAAQAVRFADDPDPDVGQLRPPRGRRHLVNALYAAVVPLGVAAYCLAAAAAGRGRAERCWATP